MSNKNYIGSQQHWEDSINADYDERERRNQEQQDDRIQPDDREPQWILTIEQLPSLGSNVEYSEDGITVEGTLDYTDERHCILAASSNFGHNFGIGFATDGNNGCDKGLICDAPKYWRYY